MSQKAWVIRPPDPNESKEKKEGWVKALREIQDWMLDHKDINSFKKADVPDLLSMKDYMNSKIGEVIEVTLPDRRKLGIYPDSQRLRCEFDVEYHASTVVNIAKLFKLFDASEIVIKEI